jgi:hypothetical protein
MGASINKYQKPNEPQKIQLSSFCDSLVFLIVSYIRETNESCYEKLQATTRHPLNPQKVVWRTELPRHLAFVDCHNVDSVILYLHEKVPYSHLVVTSWHVFKTSSMPLFELIKWVLEKRPSLFGFNSDAENSLFHLQRDFAQLGFRSLGSCLITIFDVENKWLA